MIPKLLIYFGKALDFRKWGIEDIVPNTIEKLVQGALKGLSQKGVTYDAILEQNRDNLQKDINAGVIPIYEYPDGQPERNIRNLYSSPANELAAPFIEVKNTDWEMPFAPNEDFVEQEEAIIIPEPVQGFEEGGSVTIARMLDMLGLKGGDEIIIRDVVILNLPVQVYNEATGEFENVVKMSPEWECNGICVPRSWVINSVLKVRSDLSDYEMNRMVNDGNYNPADHEVNIFESFPEDWYISISSMGREIPVVILDVNKISPVALGASEDAEVSQQIICRYIMFHRPSDGRMSLKTFAHDYPEVMPYSYYDDSAPITYLIGKYVSIYPTVEDIQGVAASSKDEYGTHQPFDAAAWQGCKEYLPNDWRDHWEELDLNVLNSYGETE